MQVNIKGGETIVKLTKAEQRALRTARGLCAQLERVCGEDSDDPGAAFNALTGVVQSYCEPEAKEAGK